MKVIVCGAGQVGFNIARYLSMENADVTVIDQTAELTRKISDSLDVTAIQGFASHPPVLQKAGAEDADMIIAVTAADEVNMIACQVAHSLFHVPTKIARIRNQNYLDPLWGDLFSRDHMPIDHIISPEVEVARAMSRRLQVPGATDMIPLANDKVRLIGVRCLKECPLINTPLRQLTQLFPDLHIVIVGILRDDKPIIPEAEDQMLAGDIAYFVVDTEHVARAMAAFGHEESEARRMVILGGGNIGLCLGQMVTESYAGMNIKVIESSKERAEAVARALPGAVVLHGDVLDPELLHEANVKLAETVVAVTNDDETNILASLLSKRYGAERSVTLINKSTYSPLITSLGIDVVVSPRAITVSTILQHIRRGRIHAVHSLHEGFGELIEADALETSPLVGTPLRDVNLPQGVLIGAVVRDGSMVISPRGDTVVKAGDRVVLFAAAKSVKKVEAMFSVRLEYF